MTDSDSQARTAHRPPLAGIRILDLTRLLPGPVCTLHLADLGADVIKIEDTGAGDYANPALRRLVQRNKRALQLDLKHPDGVAVLRRLARDADALVESFRPGVMDRLGAGYAELHALNPRLVYCSITGYGQTGPYRDEPGHDLNYCALAGVTDQIGLHGDALALSNVPIADLLGGSMPAALGIVAALFDAARTGRGRHVDVAIADGMLAHALIPMMSLARHGRTLPAGGDRLSGALPCYGLYRTADGRQLAVAALERKFWDRFCEVIGRDDLKPLHLPEDEATARAVRAQLAGLIATRTLAEWERRFAGTHCCVTPVLKLEEALQHPHFAARGMVAHAGKDDDDDGADNNADNNADDGDAAAQFAQPVRMSGYRFAVERAAPAPGQHTDEILAELGFDDAERAALRREGVVKGVANRAAVGETSAA